MRLRDGLNKCVCGEVEEREEMDSCLRRNDGWAGNHGRRWRRRLVQGSLRFLAGHRNDSSDLGEPVNPGGVAKGEFFGFVLWDIG